MNFASTQSINGEPSMQIDTQFGVQDVDPNTVLSFPLGLAGFEDLREYKLFHLDDNPTVYYLQSVQDPLVRLPLVDPRMFQVDYELTLSDAELEILQVATPDEVQILVTVARGEDGAEGDDKQIHANFMGPILINTAGRIGLQKPLIKISGSVTIRAQ